MWRKKTLDPDLFYIYPGKSRRLNMSTSHMVKTSYVWIWGRNNIQFPDCFTLFQKFFSSVNEMGLCHLNCYQNANIQCWLQKFSYCEKAAKYSFLKLLCNVKTKWEIFWHSQNIWTLWMFDSKGEKCSWKSLERVQPAQVFLAWTYVVVIFQEFT